MSICTFQRIKNVPPPKDEMFIWAYWDGKWKVGLAYHNISGGWSDSYGDRSAPARATHWAPMPDPPDD